MQTTFPQLLLGHAAKRPHPLATDSRVKQVAFDPNQVVEIVGTYGYQTMIELTAAVALDAPAIQLGAPAMAEHAHTFPTFANPAFLGPDELAIAEHVGLTFSDFQEYFENAFLPNRDFAVVGHCGIPPTAQALSVNLTSTAPTAQGHLRLYPGGTTAPEASALNYSAGQTRANNSVVSLGSLGDIGIRCTQSSGAVHVIVDVEGYFE